ncbi:lipase [Micromonospora sp. NPDC050397]|uniref:lipase n=1 Tax=Micromonospora sp. NPDC050397 TaxID=3364279 RepID=UPI00384BF090
MNPIRRTGLALVTAVAVTVASVPVSAHAGEPTGRGTVVSDSYVLGLDADEIDDYLTPVGVYVPEARHGVDAYQVVYRTVDVRGRSTTASTLVVLPRTTQRKLRPAVWLHGTQSYRRGAPSVSECCDRAAGVLFASLGYAATAPDYLGLGEGPGTHPYFHSGTMVSASVDALRATREFAAEQGRTVGGPVSVSGFSQGANGAFLLARALQRGADRHFPLGALAPISGAYELFDTEWPAALDGDVDPVAATYYLAYLTVAWNRIYHLYDNESEVFLDPYAGHVAALFDGEHTIEESMDGLPTRPVELLQPAYADLLRNPTGALGRAARANDDACLRWHPTVPVRMYAAHGDPEAVYANSLRCRESLRGADVTLTDVGNVDHITSLVRSVPQVATWFATLV